MSADGNDALRRELLAAFDAEHREHLGAMRRSLDRLAVDPGAEGELVDVFRRAHSLKGAAFAVGLPEVEGIAHRMESALVRMRDGTLALDRAADAALRRALDAIEDTVAAFNRGESLRPPADVHAALEGLGAAAAIAPAPQAAPPPVPPTAAVPADPSEAASAPFAEHFTIAAPMLDRLAGTVQELASHAHRQERVEARLRALSAQVHGLAAQRARAGTDAGDLAAIARDLDGLVRTQTAAARAFERASDELRDDTDRLFMVPVGQVLGGFGPMVRELARASGKDVTFHAEGMDIEADRRVLQAVRDPLMHVLRNAVAHGLEPPAERAAAGKDPVGEIALTALLAGSSLRLTVTDDGRGLDRAAIARRAAAEGRSAAGPDLARLLLEPGFSTAATVDALAGRGMGLSVVAAAAARLQGEVEIGPRDGPGTGVTLTLPLTVSRQSLLMLTAGGQAYALPTRAVERLVHLASAAVETVNGRSVALVDGISLPVAHLAGLLGGTAPALAGPAFEAAVLRGGAGRCLLVAGALDAVRSHRVEEAGAGEDASGLIAGTVFPDDGAPVFVLDPERLIERALAAGAAMTPPAKLDDKPPATILVVDDSLTTRTLEKSILEAHGYRVVLSVDGADALERLRETPVDLVVADVEMPRLDGFGLLQAVKADGRLAKLPFVLLTSREQEEQVRRGLELGADAYLVKQKFDQRELLATIGQLL